MYVFTFTPMGNVNDDISSEEHFGNSEISRDSYLYTVIHFRLN
jgi:hypothetical protein